MPELRRLVKIDREAWLDKRLALWPDGTRAEMSRELDQMLANAEKQPGFGIFEGDDLLAFAEASEREWGNGCLTSPVAWLEGIYVDPQYRQSGFATLLVDAVIAWAKGRRLTELGSDVQTDNTISLETHARWGFFETERLVVLRKDI